MQFAHSISTCHIHGIMLLIRLHVSEWPFIVTSPRLTCVIFMPSNRHLDMSLLWGGMDHLGKGKVLNNTDLDRFANNIWEKWVFCGYRKCLGSLSSAHETMGAKTKVLCLFSIFAISVCVSVYSSMLICNGKHTVCNIFMSLSVMPPQNFNNLMSKKITKLSNYEQ